MKLLLYGNTMECNLALKNEVLPIIKIQMIIEKSGYRKDAIFKIPFLFVCLFYDCTHMKCLE